MMEFDKIVDIFFSFFSINWGPSPKKEDKEKNERIEYNLLHVILAVIIILIMAFGIVVLIEKLLY